MLVVPQPAAGSIFVLGRDCEARTWQTSYRGPLLIVAGKRLDGALLKETIAIVGERAFHDAIDGNPTAFELSGSIIGIVRLVDCASRSSSPWSRRGSRYYQWKLEQPRLLRTPVPVRGKMGLQPTDLETYHEVLERLLSRPEEP